MFIDLFRASFVVVIVTENGAWQQHTSAHLLSEARSAGRPLPSSSATALPFQAPQVLAHLGAEGEGGQGGLMLGLLGAPGVEELEAFIAEGGSALGAAFGGL